MYVFDVDNRQVKNVSYADGKVLPSKRNSHTFTSSGEAAYVFGGASEDGPKKDLYKLDLNTLEFSYVKINEPSDKKVLLP